MAIINTDKLEVTNLDFYGIKDSLKTFLQSQSEFNDYDFDGSGLGVLLDLLSYNTHYMAFYLNMVANEMFMDTASQRSSIVGIARQLGYTPKSTQGAIAKINLTLNVTGGLSVVTLPRWTPFSVTVDKDKFLFYTTSSVLGNVSSNKVTYNNVSIKEGVYVKNTYIYNSQGKKQRFILDNDGVDTTTLVVTVKGTKTTGTTSTYTVYKDLEGLDSTSNVYFLQEVEDGRYEIYFGDGIYGKKLEDENYITVEYLTSNGSAANYAGLDSNNPFVLDSSPTNTTSPLLTLATDGQAGGGSNRESPESIKFNAPLSYAAQDRAVTANDYKNIILSNYGNTRGVKIWGGDPTELSNSTPGSGLQNASGTAYISILPKYGKRLPSATKDYIIHSILAPYKILGIKNQIVDPNYIDLLVEINAHYNPTATELPEDTLKQNIINQVKKYSVTDLEIFDGKFRHSVLTARVNETDKSVVANNIKVRYQKEMDFGPSDLQRMEPGPAEDIAENTRDNRNWHRMKFSEVDYGMGIDRGTVQSNKFYVWAHSLPNFSSVVTAGDDVVYEGKEYPEEYQWSQKTRLFAWSMIKTDTLADSVNEVHAGKVLECYFRDDGEGRLLLINARNNKMIPYFHLKDSYKESNYSWIETQATGIGWGSGIEGGHHRAKESILDHRWRYDNWTVDSSGKISGTINPEIRDYESWGRVNYRTGQIFKIKPLSILSTKADVIEFPEGETPLPIAKNSSWSSGNTPYTSITLTSKNLGIKFSSQQYSDMDVRLGGYSSSGNQILQIDSTYLSSNTKMVRSTDNPPISKAENQYEIEKLKVISKDVVKEDDVPPLPGSTPPSTEIVGGEGWTPPGYTRSVPPSDVEIMSAMHRDITDDRIIDAMHNQAGSDFVPEVETTIEYTATPEPDQSMKDYMKNTYNKVWDEEGRMFVLDETRQDTDGAVETDDYATTSDGIELGFSTANVPAATDDSGIGGEGWTPPGYFIQPLNDLFSPLSCRILYNEDGNWIS